MPNLILFVTYFLFISACASSLPSPVTSEFRDEFRISEVEVIYTHQSDINEDHSPLIRTFIDGFEDQELKTKLDDVLDELTRDSAFERGYADALFAYAITEGLREQTAATWQGERAARLKVFIDGIAVAGTMSGAFWGDYQSATSRYELVEEATGERIAWRDRRAIMMVGNDNSAPASRVMAKLIANGNSSIGKLATIASMVNNDIASTLNASASDSRMRDVETNVELLNPLR